MKSVLEYGSTGIFIAPDALYYTDSESAQLIEASLSTSTMGHFRYFALLLDPVVSNWFRHCEFRQ